MKVYLFLWSISKSATDFHPRISPLNCERMILYRPGPCFLCILLMRLFHPVLVGGMVGIGMFFGFQT